MAFLRPKEEFFLNNMPKSKLEQFVFTIITAFLMVYGMTIYNTVLNTDTFENMTFLYALRSMWIEFVIVFLCAMFIVPPIAKKLAFKIVSPTDRPMLIILSIQTFTVITMVTIITAFVIILHNGFTNQLIPIYLKSYVVNFAMALPLQIFLVGPITRKIFRTLFRKKSVE